VLDTYGFVIVALANGWVTITSPGAPAPDKPDVTLEPPADLGRVSGFMNIPDNKPTAGRTPGHLP
jgi:hypothetical protein